MWSSPLRAAAAAAESFYGACRAAAPGSLADELPKAMGRAVEEQQQAAKLGGSVILFVVCLFVHLLEEIT